MSIDLLDVSMLLSPVGCWCVYPRGRGVGVFGPREGIALMGPGTGDYVYCSAGG